MKYLITSIIAVIASGTFLIAPTIVTTSESSSYTLACEGGDSYEVVYEISNGKVNGMSVAQGSLSVLIDASDKGTISLDIPRQLIDARNGNEDDWFIILLSGYEVERGKAGYQETTESPHTKSRTLIIPFSEGNNLDIEIIKSGIPDPQFGKKCTGVESSAWKIQNTTVGEQTFKIPYKIASGTANIIVDHEAGSIVAVLSNDSEGVLDIIIPRNLLDATTPDGREDEYFVLVNGEESKYKEEKSVCFRELSVNFPPQSENIEIIATITYQIPRSKVPPVYMNTDKTNYESGESVTISGCTDLALDYKEVTLDILNPDGKTYDVVSIPTKPDGTFSYSFQASGELGIDGNYTVNASYGDNMASHTFTIPEFPIMPLVLAVGITATLIVTRTKWNQISSFPK